MTSTEPPALPTRFGAFIAPYHDPAGNPTLQLRRDLELAVLLDELGYDEVWFGEHHSGAYEMSASPEVMIAAAGERTRRIMLGTGVSSLTYHHPFMLADRIMQLDHLTAGRVMLGMGPGQLPSDAFMMGIDPRRQRDMMVEAAEVIVRLLRGEVVTAKTDWFTLDGARLQLRPYARDGIELAVASTSSPSAVRRSPAGWAWRCSPFPPLIPAVLMRSTRTGATSNAPRPSTAIRWIAGAGGWSRRCIWPRRASRPSGRWSTACSRSTPTWSAWVIASFPGPDQRVRPSRIGRRTGCRISGSPRSGTPDDAIATIARLTAKTGGFGTFLFLAHNCADWQATRRSYELFAEYVIPACRGMNDHRDASIDWVGQNSEKFFGAMQQATREAIAKYSRPDVG